MWFELHETIPEFVNESSKYKEVFHWLPMPSILNANTVLRVSADLKGVKIQSAGMMADML